MLVRKKWLIVFGAVFLVVALATVGFAASPIKLIVNGQEIKPDVSPQIINGRTMVPVRSVAEALGADVQWDAKNRQVLIAQPKGSTIISNPTRDTISQLDYFMEASETISHFLAHLSRNFVIDTCPEIDMEELSKRHPGDKMSLIEATGIPWLQLSGSGAHRNWLRINEWDILRMEMTEKSPESMQGAEIKATVKTIEHHMEPITLPDYSYKEGPYETFERTYDITLMWKIEITEGVAKAGWKVVDIKMLSQRKISPSNTITLPFDMVIK